MDAPLKIADASPSNGLPENNENKTIRTYGFELVLVAIVMFIAIIGLSILSYRFFIMERVKKSDEFYTASYFVSNSETLQKYLLDQVIDMELADMSVSENDNTGRSHIVFELKLKNGLEERVSVALLKVSDFWMVYDVTLSPGTPMAYRLFSTYDKTTALIERLFYGDSDLAYGYLKLIEKENRDPHLNDYLKARVGLLKGNQEYALQLLQDLEHRVSYSKMAVIYEQGLVHFTRGDYDKAKETFQRALDEKLDYEKRHPKKRYERDMFAGMPRDPFIAQFSHDTLKADVLKDLALTFYEMKNYDEGLSMAILAMKQASEISSKTVASSARFVKALNIFKLERWDEAEQAFDDVIQDVDNSNLKQKSWAYYYKGKIGAILRKPSNAFDYFERAVLLAPSNFIIRKDVIHFLMNRNAPGDLEIALSLALRGIQDGSQPEMFKNLSSLLYGRLHTKDKTPSIQ